MKIFYLLLFFCLTSLFFSSCVSPGLGPSDAFDYGPELDQDTPGTREQAKAQEIFYSDSREISQLYSDVLEKQVAGPNLQKLNALLAKDNRSSLELAILALNLMHNFVASQMSLQDDFFEIPLKEKVKPVSLAELSALYNIDLIELIENNRFLQSVEIYRILIKLKEFQDQGTMSEALATVIDNKLIYFKEFVLLSEALLKSQQETSTSLDSEESKDPKYSAEDILEQVENFLSTNSFYDAIGLLKQIDEKDKTYDLAQQKIIMISRRAVDDLRKRAALSYQNANHIDTDIRARESYLLEAKSFLETAVELYPEAEQIGRVQRNLKIIDDNLEFLKKGRLKER